MTPEQLAEEIAIELGEDFTDNDIREQYLAWSQDSLDELFTSARWLQANGADVITTSPGLVQYPLAANASEVLAMNIIDNGSGESVEVVHTPREVLLRRFDSLLSTLGVPEAWYYGGVDVDGNILVNLFPVPDSVTYNIIIQVLEQPPVPTPSSEIPLSREHVAVLKEMVRFRAYRNGNQSELAQLSFQIYSSRLDLLASRFTGPFRGSTRLPIKNRMRIVDQAPGASDGD